MSSFKVLFIQQSEVEDSLFQYAVIASRYREQWLYCRHKERTTWEIPGGHREEGESIEQTARRELQEETGAVDFELRPVSAYGVDRDGKCSYGMLYFANVGNLEMLNDKTEIGEVRSFEIPPTDLTYPDIQPELHERVQAWLNLQTNADELWDVYDENRNLTGRLHRRGNPLSKGDYHISVHVWMQNRNGEFLLTKRSPNKGFPNMWETTGGSALAGDDSLTAALREVREETGLNLQPENGKCVISRIYDECFCDVWLFRQDFDLKEVVLLEGETCDAKYASIKEIQEMLKDGIFIAYAYWEELMKIIEKENETYDPS